MQKLLFDNGIQEFEVNGKEILRFNPTDPNVYSRFFEVFSEIEQMEQDFEKEVARLNVAADKKASLVTEKEEEIPGNGDKVVKLMHDLDVRLKERLQYVFGAENNFNKILDGVNMLAVAGNGQRVVTNLFSALMPIIETGAQAHMDKEVSEVKANRAARRAAQ